MDPGDEELPDLNVGREKSVAPVNKTLRGLHRADFDETCISCNEFYSNRMKNLENKGKISFPPVSLAHVTPVFTKITVPHWFIWRSRHLVSHISVKKCGKCA
jgi:hypothetical protein